MSYLDAQLNAFKSNLNSSSQKLSNKRTVAAPTTSTPSPAPSHASAASRSDEKRKRVEPTNVVYSQPANTGSGTELITQITYAIEYLKQKGTAQSLQDLLSYLSLQYTNKDYKTSVTKILRNHERVEYDRTGLNGQGSYRFRPIHDIRTGDQLLGYLQAQRTFLGLNAKELRDGWVDAEDEVRRLEKEGRLLVTRNRKDDNARMVWPNDPTLSVTIDDEFKDLWKKTKLPEPAALAEDLEKAGLTPTNKSRSTKIKPKVQEKKTKKPRKSGKMTNVHMLGVLRDFSHLKK